MLLSILWTLSREKKLPQKELGLTFQPALFRQLKITITNWENKIMQSVNEQESGNYNYPYYGSGSLGAGFG